MSEAQTTTYNHKPATPLRAPHPCTGRVETPLELIVGEPPARKQRTPTRALMARDSEYLRYEKGILGGGQVGWGIEGPSLCRASGSKSHPALHLSRSPSQLSKTQKSLLK